MSFYVVLSGKYRQLHVTDFSLYRNVAFCGTKSIFYRTLVMLSLSYFMTFRVYGQIWHKCPFTSKDIVTNYRLYVRICPNFDDY